MIVRNYKQYCDCIEEWWIRYSFYTQKWKELCDADSRVWIQTYELVPRDEYSKINFNEEFEAIKLMYRAFIVEKLQEKIDERKDIFEQRIATIKKVIDGFQDLCDEEMLDKILIDEATKIVQLGQSLLSHIQIRKEWKSKKK